VSPYYQDSAVTIYHGDCREVSSQLETVDLVLTDPPYGINAARARKSQKWGWRDFDVCGWDATRPELETLKICTSAGRHFILWGANYFPGIQPLPECKWLIWDKCQSDFSLADAEMALCSWVGAIRRLRYSRATALKDGKQHPTQKPLEVMTWCINQAPDGCVSILDPFMGSGTTLRAAKNLGRKAIGIEIEERYCEIAAKRMQQEVLAL
jgi:DNA modification methylase